MEDLQNKKMAIVGAGLAGAMAAGLLAKLGFEITVFERRPEPTASPHSSSSSSTPPPSSVHGNAANAQKRSINLALSQRGIAALQELDGGILSQVLAEAVPMPGRVIHRSEGAPLLQPYGLPGQQLQSVGRLTLNALLLRHLQRCANVRLVFGCLVRRIDHVAGRLTVTRCQQGGRAEGEKGATGETGERAGGSKAGEKEEEEELFFDLIVGADGAYSQVREGLLQSHRVNFSRTYVRHGYKELSIPPAQDEKGEACYALESPYGLHIWPRGEFMLIALPNPDKSFTATLFAPFRGENGFDQYSAERAGGGGGGGGEGENGGAGENSDRAIVRYFQQHFPDVLPHMPSLLRDFRENPVGSLVTVRVDPWAFGKTLLIGDAAHAVVPFYGQGMNAAFQDALMLYQIVKERLQSAGSVRALDLSRCARHFASLRQPAAHALSELCLEHYHDMASNTRSPVYLAYKSFEQLLQRVFPSSFTPLYSLVAFSETPYHIAVERARQQENTIAWIGATSVLSIVGALGYFALKHNQARKLL